MLVGGGTFSGIAPEKIGLLPGWISSDNVKIRAGPEILMANAGRNYDHVAGLHMGVNSHRVSETKQCIASIDAQDLVGRTMIVRKGIDAIAPCGAPVILSIEVLEGSRQLLSAGPDHSFVDQQRQAWIVGYIARVCKEMLFRLAHKRLPLTVSSPATRRELAPRHRVTCFDFCVAMRAVLSSWSVRDKIINANVCQAA
jgi:hypothetical protein